MLMRLAYGAVSVPVRLYNFLYTRRLLDYCTAAEGVTFYPQAKIYNSAGPEAIRIHTHEHLAQIERTLATHAAAG